MSGGPLMLKSLILWVSFAGAMFFDYSIPDKVLMEEYGRGAKANLITHQNYVLTSWNVYKGGMEGMHADLAQIINESDFVNLQEFLLDSAQAQQIQDFDVFHWVFAKSFKDSDNWTGVTTISRTEPMEALALRSADAQPLSNTPKMSLITKFQIQGGQELWIANMHAINFNVGMGAFERQVDSVINNLRVHTGPLIFTGDFNTWAPGRYEYLLDKAWELGLTRVELDSPVGFFSVTMDHIFYRGLKDVKGSVLHQYTTSDHVPLRIEFKL